jgi:NADP-dependent 3-hydroxy acid dehydrogenase YdfG
MKKTIFITGGSNGIGAAAVRKFASESLFTMPGEIVRAGKNFLQIFSSS